MDRQREVNEYLDGRLRPEHRAAFEASLAEDPELAEEVFTSERTLALLRAAYPPEQAPVHLADRVMAEVRTKPMPLRPVGFAEVLRHLLAPSRLAFSAVAVTCLVAVGMWQMNEPEPVALSGTDQAFVSECLRDYHLDASARLGATVADVPVVAGLEF